jgi:hypothetical protein
VQRILSSIEANPDGQPLDDFHEIAAPVLRREKTEESSCGAGKIIDSPSNVPIESVHMYSRAFLLKRPIGRINHRVSKTNPNARRKRDQSVSFML